MTVEASLLSPNAGLLDIYVFMEKGRLAKNGVDIDDDEMLYVVLKEKFNSLTPTELDEVRSSWREQIAKDLQEAANHVSAETSGGDESDENDENAAGGGRSWTSDEDSDSEADSDSDSEEEDFQVGNKAKGGETGAVRELAVEELNCASSNEEEEEVFAGDWAEGEERL